MSMHLRCEYKETFKSKLGIELTFRDVLRLVDTPGQQLAYEMYGNKTNLKIFVAYLEWVTERLQGDREYLDYHIKECKKFFKKYGIQNVEFFVC